MSFSIFNKKNIDHTSTVIVVDFVNKEILLSKKINNLRPLLDSENKDVIDSIEESKKIRNSVQGKEDTKTEIKDENIV